MPRRRPALIPFRQAWRFASVRFGLLVPLLVEVWLALTDDQRAELLSLAGIPAERLVSVGALVAVFLRVLATQPAPRADTEKDAAP